MANIATHDSATGEKGQGLLSWLLTPFARTQSKTIKEQYEAGCRMFDIRVKAKDDLFYCAHGWWYSEKRALEVLEEINDFPERCYVALTYEGKFRDDAHKIQFIRWYKYAKEAFPNISWGGIGIKYGKGSSLFNVKFEYLESYPSTFPKAEAYYKKLDGRSWHILLPIPWLWKQIYYRKVEFSNEEYRWVDFL